MIATPRPPSTRGSSSDLAYTRSPGFDTRLMPARLGSRFWPYFGSRPRGLPAPPSTSAMFAFIFENGMVTRSWYAWLALRRRVSMSAIGSVIVMGIRQPFSPGFPARGLRRSGGAGLLPGSLRHTGQFAAVGHLADAHAAQTELAVDRGRAAATLAAGVGANSELGLRGSLEDQRLLGHAQFSLN